MKEDQNGHLDRLRTRVADELDRQIAAVRPAGLYLVPTPIGNLGDVTLRALATLTTVDSVLCEDTRHSGKLLSHFGIKQTLTSFHDHNEARSADKIVAQLQAGRSLALISDAGMPLISDPGFKLVAKCLEAGIVVTALPGPSAPVAALAASGLAVDRFLFAGFLPAKDKAREDALRDLSDVRATLVFFESPQRLARMLSETLRILGDRPVAVAREISKLHETIWTGNLVEAVREFADGVRGELVICIGPAVKVEANDVDVQNWIAEQLAGQATDVSVKDLARQAADHFGIPRKQAYDMVLASRNG